MVGWDMSQSLSRSQAQLPSAGPAEMMESSRSLMGSASTFASRARWLACSGSSGWPPVGGQHCGMGCG